MRQGCVSHCSTVLVPHLHNVVCTLAGLALNPIPLRTDLEDMPFVLVQDGIAEL